MGINNTLVPIKIISPQLIQQVLPGQYPALMGQQFPQYFKFLLCQFKISSVHGGGVAVTVQKQIAISNDLILYLKLLDNLHDETLILPMRLLNQSNNHNSLYEIGEQVFISLFNGINSLSDYFFKCDSIDDIMHFAREDIGRLVMFSEDDDATLPFEGRFKIALSGTQYMVDTNKPDAYNFFMFVFGCIQQAIDVIVSCVEYGCIPYIRYPVALHYISLLSESMLDIEHIVKLRFKMSVAFVVYQLCDKGRLARVSLEEFLKQIQAYNFNEKLFRVLAEHDINENSFLGHTITQLVIDELEAFYNILSEESGI